MDQDGHCGQDVCVIAVSEERHKLEDLIEEKKKSDCFRYSKLRIHDGIEYIGRNTTRESTQTE
jgi:hypothetical protein